MSQARARARRGRRGSGQGQGQGEARLRLGQGEGSGGSLDGTLLGGVDLGVPPQLRIIIASFFSTSCLCHGLRPRGRRPRGRRSRPTIERSASRLRTRPPDSVGGDGWSGRPTRRRTSCAIFRSSRTGPSSSTAASASRAERPTNAASDRAICESPAYAPAGFCWGRWVVRSADTKADVVA